MTTKLTTGNSMPHHHTRPGKPSPVGGIAHPPSGDSLTRSYSEFHGGLLGRTGKLRLLWP